MKIITKLEKLRAVSQASKEDDLDSACLIIQNAYGITTGDIAAYFFCGREDEWFDGSTNERITLLGKYIKLEELDFLKAA